MSEDLAGFLHARLAEDERNAQERRGIFPSPGVDPHGTLWLHVRPGGNAVLVRQRDPIEGYDDLAKLKDWASASHGWTQERVLAEVAAKRRLVEALLSEGHAVLAPGGSTEIYCPADYGTGESCSCGRDERVGRYLGHLALPYANHPEYRPEWAPDAEIST